jgi:hypothetical protein
LKEARDVFCELGGRAGFPIWWSLDEAVLEVDQEEHWRGGSHNVIIPAV